MAEVNGALLSELRDDFLSPVKKGQGHAPQRTKKRKAERVLSRLQSNLSITVRHDLAPLVHWRGEDNLPIHRWLRYREAYSPNLISKLKLGKRILDPFCGCGSIMVGAAQLGRQSLGVDLNPLATFAARVKLNPLSKKQVKAVTEFSEKFVRLQRKETPWPVPTLSIATKVFEPDILETLLKLRTAIEKFSDKDIAVRDFLLLAWLAILEKVGSYFKEGNGIKYRNKKRLKTGYIKREEGAWQKERFGDDQAAFALEEFRDQLSKMIIDTAFWKGGTWKDQSVIEANALDLDTLIPDQKFDSIIFSPPYANRFDYFESLKVELWFGDFVSSYEDANHLRKLSLRSHLGADLSRPAKTIEPLEDLISMMDPDSSSWRMRMPTALRGYFDDMFQILQHSRALAPKGRCFVVVGNSAFAGVIIPTDSLIAQLGLQAGFTKAEVVTVRHLTVAPQQRSLLQGLEGYMRESVVILQ